MSPKGCQNEGEIAKKSVKKTVENCIGFLIGFGWFLFGFWECFGDPGPSKMSVSCKRGAIFQKFTFLLLMRFDFGLIFNGFWVVFGSTFGANMLPKWV